ncbi:MAG: Ltp family lipoprotein [Minwuia sp.]|nr:Ltp family lipoprotein [Minwuia sp.]
MHRAAALIPDLAASDITRPDTIVPDCQWRNSMKKTAVALAFFCVLVSASFAAAQSLTGPQRNAVRSANNYLSFQGFSRDGLIEQLSSPYGDGYSRADATAAVNSLAVDWNEQAARSAEQYLSIMGFSCNGLIAQLSSDAGSKFTTSEATYGARKAGAC